MKKLSKMFYEDFKRFVLTRGLLVVRLNSIDIDTMNITSKDFIDVHLFTEES